MPELQQEHPRERMVRSALALMGEQGVEATSFSQVIEHSGAPRGSIYHHFPGGKAQLVDEATRYAGEIIVDLLNEAAERNEDPVAALDSISEFWRTLLHDSEFAAGCPVLAAVLEGDRSPAARDTAREVFARWQRIWTELLARAGVDKDRARSLAAIAISATEGAVILARSQRSNLPLERVARELRTLFHQAIEDSAAR
jgi:TetR/AcrR family transcriptional regulator, lmrAB and yxaGH operons repressor